MGLLVVVISEPNGSHSPTEAGSNGAESMLDEAPQEETLVFERWRFEDLGDWNQPTAVSFARDGEVLELALKERNSPGTRPMRKASNQKVRMKYDARTQSWRTLPPARIPQSSDNCVGYCFDAIIHSVSDADRRVARVVVFGTDGRPMRAFVQRTRPYVTPSSPLEERRSVRFACFERAEEHPVPRFEGCKHFATGITRTERPRSAGEQTFEPGGFDMIDPL